MFFYHQQVLALFISQFLSIVRPGDELLVTDPIYSPTRLLVGEFLKEFKIKTIFYDPNDINDLKKKNFQKKQNLFL